MIVLDLYDNPEYAVPEIAKVVTAVRDSALMPAATIWAARVIYLPGCPLDGGVFKYKETKNDDD